MCRAISFFSMSNDAQFESGAIQDTRILTGSAFDAPCAKSEIAAMRPINQDRTSHICPSRAGPARKLTIATFAAWRWGCAWRPRGPTRDSFQAAASQDPRILDDESAHPRSPTDIQRLASHEAIGPVAEEYHGPRDIVAAPQPLHRNGRRKRLLAFAVLRNNAAEHLGVRDRPGRNHVHG